MTAVQVSYPGVYLEETTPAAPIQGVGTGTAAFVGTAVAGPVRTPTRIQSWDAYVSLFGGFPVQGPRSFLAEGVYGFFLNGGTDAFVVRAATGATASVALDSRQGGASPEPVLLLTALTEGRPGNALTAQVAESSRLADALAAAVPASAVTAVPDAHTLTVDRTDAYAPGTVVTVTRGGASATAVVEGVASGTLRLAADLPTAAATTGTVAPAAVLAVHTARATVTSAPDRATLVLDDAAGFAVGDSISVEGGGVTAVGVVRTAVSGTLGLTAPLPGSQTLTGAVVRTADLVAGQTTLRVDVPPNLSLAAAVPTGSVVSLSPATGTGGEVVLVATAAGDTVTLAQGLRGGHPVPDRAGAPRLATLEFDLDVSDASSGTTEHFPRLSTTPRHPAYWGTAITSALVQASSPPAPPAPAPDDPRPVARAYPLTGGTADDRAAAWADLTARPADHLALLTPYAEISLVVVPGAVDPAVQQAIVTHCESTANRFAVLDVPQGADPDGALAALANARSASGFAALYYPWMTVRHPVTGAVETWAPSGHVTGAYALTDANRGVHKAPANVPLRGAVGVERRLTDNEQGPLNLAGVNALRVFPGQTQPLVWGARTTAGDLNRNWQYVNVRRLFIFLEQSITQGIRWAVFEPNDLGLWQRLKRTIGEFLTAVWRDGALFGATPEEAFYVRIDEVLNPPSTRALGRLVIEVGVAPTYPAEFLVLRIGIWPGGSDVTEG